MSNIGGNMGAKGENRRKTQKNKGGPGEMKRISGLKSFFF